MVIGIIEDDNLLRKALDTSLQNQGYTTILAASRKEAIKNIDSSVDLLNKGIVKTYGSCFEEKIK